MSNDRKNPAEAKLKACEHAGDDHRATWDAFVSAQCWLPGSRDKSSWVAALRAASLGIPPEIVFAEISRRINATEVPDPAKIQSQIARARKVALETEAGQPPRLRNSSRYMPQVLERIAARVSIANLDQFLEERSCTRIGQLSSGDFLSLLYPRGEKVLIFTRVHSQGQVLWPDEARQIPVGRPDGVWFLPNPVDGQSHFNPRMNKLSRRSEESVTSFRFAVIESDEAEQTTWLKCLVQLPLRIAAIYESGGRSIHALVRMDAESKFQWDAKMRLLKPILTTLGADPGALTAVRLSRLPQAKRGDRLQRLLYLKPNPTPTPIH